MLMIGNSPKGFRFAPRLFTNNDFWRVSADTKTCGSPLYLAPAGGLYWVF